jgi:RecA/RadA recombinase
VEEMLSAFGDEGLIVLVSREEALDQLTDFVRTNGCQVVGVNSLGFFQTNAKDEKESLADNPQQRSEAQVITRFLTRLSNIQNQMVLNESTGMLEANETSVILVNQVRSRDQMPRTMPGRTPQEKDKYRPASEAWALKHGKVIELSLHKGTKLWDETTKKFYGKEVQWEITKGKLGLHEGPRGAFQFYYANGVDKTLDLVRTAKELGVIEGESWLTFKSSKYDLRLNGEKQFSKAIEKDPALYRHLRRKCFAAAKVIYRHT